METPQHAYISVNQDPDLIHVYHLRRSGGHGVIDWLLGHCHGKKVHYNQARPLSDGTIRVPRTQISQSKGEASGPTFQLFSFEDVPLNHLVKHLMPPKGAVLLLRDPFNSFASRLKIVRQHQQNDRFGHARANRIDPGLWKQYARGFLNRDCLPHAVRVNFNRWYQDTDYRRELAAELGWEFTDKGYGSRDGWRYSHGSSFGDQDPKRLDLFNRWKFYQDDEEYCSYFDEETRQLSSQIFGFLPPIQPKQLSPQEVLNKLASQIVIASARPDRRT